MMFIRIASRLLRSYARTWRIAMRYEDGRSAPPAQHRFERDVYAIRERDLVAVSGLWRFTHFVTLVAQGRDGDMATIVAEELGGLVVRGSSRHEPAGAAMAFVRALRETEAPALLVVDGPLGPSGVAKEGVAAVARLTGRRIIPLAAEVRAKIVLRGSWSRTIIPLPFARVTFAVGESIAVNADASRDALAGAANRVSAHFAGAAA